MTLDRSLQMDARESPCVLMVGAASAAYAVATSGISPSWVMT